MLEGKKILIVDDELDVLDTLATLLSSSLIEKATNFEDAKELLESKDFDIAILDVMGVNGFDLLDIAKARGTIAVMLTAHALSPENIIRSYKGGAASYIPKEEMYRISTFLEDILEARARQKSPWWRWLLRLGQFWRQEFGADWQKHDEEFWKEFNRKF